MLTDLTRPADIEKVNIEIETNLTSPIHLSSLFVKHFTG